MAAKRSKKKSTLPPGLDAREGSVVAEVGVDEYLAVTRVRVESTRVVALDLTPAELRAMLAGAKTHDASRLAGAIVWLRCRVPEGEGAPTPEEVREYLRAAGALAARVDVSEVAVRRDRAEPEVAKLASARERMDWWLARSLAAASVRAEVARVMDAEGL